MIRRTREQRGGFTLAEVAVTLVVVGIGLLFVLQGLSTSKFTAAHTHNRKVARELALYTLGEIQAGLYREDLDDERLFGNYGDQGYEEWQWQVIFGDETFRDEENRDEGMFFDTFRERERRAQENDEDDDEEQDEDATEPFEKVRIRVYFPKLGDFPNDLTLELWMPWEDVYGPEDAALEEAENPAS